MIFLEALPIALLGALLGLDVVSFPQAMVSRPIVASTLAGTLVGNPPAGLLIGVVLEMIALDTLPFGASRYPEWGSAAVVGGALFAAQPMGMPGALPASMLAALLTASISGWSMVVLRRLIASQQLAARNFDCGAGRLLGCPRLEQQPRDGGDRWERFSAQESYSVEGHYFVTPELVHVLAERSGLRPIKRSCVDPANFYFNRDYLVVLEK